MTKPSINISIQTKPDLPELTQFFKHTFFNITANDIDSTQKYQDQDLSHRHPQKLLRQRSRPDPYQKAIIQQ
jgi:hypothetical protein